MQHFPELSIPYLCLKQSPYGGFDNLLHMSIVAEQIQLLTDINVQTLRRRGVY